ncbi:hypothetical protein [Labrys neptuniae]
MAGNVETQDHLEIGLDASEAVVLFELLSRWCDPKTGATPAGSCFESTAECVVLHRLLGSLEKQLVAPFKHDHAETLARARSHLQHDWDYPTLNG